jgi:murein DD-endopeptidase MepM/ murein hydrolase activator NlpD
MDGRAIAASMIVRGADNAPMSPAPSSVAVGQTAVVFMLHEIPNGTVIADHLLVNVSLRYGDGTIETAGLDVPVLAVAPVVLGPPLRGGPWLAINALSGGSLHRRTVPPFADVHVPERYAIDYLLASDAGRIANAPGTANADHYAYGKELLAVGDGTIKATLDRLPDNVPGKGPATVTRENIAGNMITLALDGGGYVLYAHLQPGSLRVKLDNRVKKGDVLGLLGNSGNSSAAHLHIHVSDRPDPLESEGIPFVFESFSYVGQIVGGTGDEVTWGPRANEPQKRALPAEDEANAF